MNGIMEAAAKGSVHFPVLLKRCPVNHDAPSRAAGVRTFRRNAFKMIVIVGNCVYHICLLINAGAFPRRAALHRWCIPSVPQNNPLSPAPFSNGEWCRDEPRTGWLRPRTWFPEDRSPWEGMAHADSGSLLPSVFHTSAVSIQQMALRCPARISACIVKEPQHIGMVPVQMAAPGSYALTGSRHVPGMLLPGTWI